MNVADWNPSYYVWGGPGVGETSTSVARTLGWHKFELRVTAVDFTALIDNIVVGSVLGNYTFDTYRLLLSGPGFRPDAVFYFDDFTFEDGSETLPPILGAPLGR